MDTHNIAFSLLFPLFFSMFICLTLSEPEIPVAMWNIKGNSLHLKPVSALGNDDGLFQNILSVTNHANLLVFAVNQLSLEDFSENDIATSTNNTIQNLQTFLDSQPHMFLSRVENPLAFIRNAKCGVKEVVVEKPIDKDVIASIYPEFEQSCVVILHIKDNDISGIKDSNEDYLKEIFLPPFDSSNDNFVGVFTSEKSSWVKSEDSVMFRHLLETEEATAVNNNFVNISGCLIAYVENGTIKIGEKGNATSRLQFPPDSTGSKCGNSSVLQLKFKVTGDITEATFRFEFSRVKNGWETKTTVEMEGAKAPTGTINLDANDFGASLGFSYSCGTFELISRNESILVTLDGFQVQPFEVKEKFSDSFNCVTWFTIPIWMGIFVALIFIIIINVGVYALFSVHTMDRFDDPKGKTISVAVGAE